MKQCTQCHRVYGHEAFFCLEDGTPLTDTRDPEATEVKTVYLSTPPAPAKLTPAPNKKIHPVVWVIVLLAGAATLIIIGMAIARNMYEKSPESAPQASATPLPSPFETSTPERKRKPRATPLTEPTSDSTSLTPSPSAPVLIGPEIIYLEKSQYQQIPFSTGPNGGQVTGQFSARGGMENDIRVIILAATELENYKNKYPYRRYYEEEVNFGNVGNISITLPPGSYYAIIANPSPWTARRVRAPIFLKIY